MNNIYPDTTDLLRNVTLTGYGERTSYIAGPPLSLLFEGARGGYDVKFHAITATPSPRLRLLVGVSFTPSARADARFGTPPTLSLGLRLLAGRAW